MARWRGGKASTRSGKKWSDFDNRPEIDHCQLNKHLQIIGAKTWSCPPTQASWTSGDSPQQLWPGERLGIWCLGRGKPRCAQPSSNTCRGKGETGQPGNRSLFKSEAAQLAGEVAFLRRRLSLTAVQSQARLLVDRLQLLGDGSREAGRRRDRAQEARRTEIREKRVQYVCPLQGRNIQQNGFGLLD